MRIFIISDIHVDYAENFWWVDNLSNYDYREDVLILAGDVTHKFTLLKSILKKLRKKFKRLFFVPGNHELWLNDDGFTHSLEKFHAIIDYCQKIDIEIQPKTFENQNILIYPVFSWYQTKNEPGTLYLPKPGEQAVEKIMSDFYHIKWPNKDIKPFNYFMNLNKKDLANESQKLVITFSHFLPRQELMFSRNNTLSKARIKKFDRYPPFNFSEVAGSQWIDGFIRKIGTKIHIYGHQHINRDRIIDGVRYVAHCLGYPEERRRGMVQGIEQGLKCIWP